MTNLMKGGLKYILILILIVGVLLPTDFAFAGTWNGFVESLSSGASAVVTPLVTAVFWLVSKFMGWVMGLSGLILNKVIDLTIFQMANSIRDLTGINTAWKVIKDLMNIGFIFMLVYQSILVILSIEDASSVRKFVFGIFLASILINFSLFFTKIIIDASNVVTIGIYNNIVVPNPNATLLTDGLSNAYIQRLQLQNFYRGDQPTITSEGQAFAFIGISILYLIVSFVFLAISVMFIVRYIILLALLALSPIAYMGLAWRGMKKHADNWWNSFWGQIIWPPTYMIMTWVVLTIMGDQGFLGNTGLSYSQLSGINDPVQAQGAASVIVNFALIIGLTIASVVISKQFATQGASQIGKFTSSATSFAGGALLGGAARIGRGTIGRYGERLASNEDLKRRADEGNIAARLQLAAANRASTSTFDARATRAGKTAIGQVIGQETGFGKVDEKKDTFRAIREERLKAVEKKQERYKPSDLAVLKAKEKLTSQDFRIEEAKRKAGREEYLKSDAYKNSAEGKQRQKLNDDNKAAWSVRQKNEKELAESENELKNTDVRINKLEEQKARFNVLYEKSNRTPEEEVLLRRLGNTAVSDNQELQRMKEQRGVVLKKITDSRARTKEVEIKIADRTSEIEKLDTEERLWMSDEMKELIAISGGQKEVAEKGEGGKTVVTQSAVESAYQQRLGKEADRFEKRGAIWRYTANTAGAISSVVGLTPQPLTRNDRQEAGRRIRKLGKGKTAEKEMEDLFKKMRKERKEKGEKFAEDEDETKGETTSSAPTPPPTPPPTGGAVA